MFETTRRHAIKFALGGLVGLIGLSSSRCGEEPKGLMESDPAAVTVEFDWDNKPLPEVPLPNDLATRPDSSSPTGLRLNASMVAPTGMERQVRQLVDSLDGWGLQMPIAIPFTGEIDVESVLKGHRDVDYDLDNDVVYLINIDRDSKEFGRVHHLDVGNGNYPVAMEALDKYGPWDPRGWSLSLPFEEADEDVNGNGKLDYPETDKDRDGKVDESEDKNGNGYLDPPEDTDADGVLDVPNYLPGHNPARDDLAGRADALMTFYEKETNTLLVAPMVPLRERTTYAVIVTKRIKDMDGDPVGSPFKYINHIAQNQVLAPLPDALAESDPDIDIDLGDIAFTWAFTTQTAESAWVAVRDGLYGEGVQAHIGEEFPAELAGFMPLKDGDHPLHGGKNLHLVYHENWETALEFVAGEIQGGKSGSIEMTDLMDSHKFVDYHVMGWYDSPQLFDREDEDGNVLPLDLQSWPQDLTEKPAKTRSEKVYFWLVVPRKEVSARQNGGQVPLVILGHGYGSNRVGETIGFAGYFAQFGVATLAVDNVSHGLPFDENELNLDQFQPILDAFGLNPLLDAATLHRAADFDKDGIVDSGADFWTSYLFHTRDNMRQSALDYMQLVRIIRSFDGERKWAFDLDANGTNELAGDFDGDGKLDIGQDSEIYAMGGSLGGIMSTILGGAEPEVKAVMPIAGGGRLTDVGGRSLQGGVPQAVIHRIMGNTFYVVVADSGNAQLRTYLTELNGDKDILISNFGADLKPGDTMVVANLDAEVQGCAYILPDDNPDDQIVGGGRAQIEADTGDRLEVRFYRGPSLVEGSTECEVVDGAKPIHVVDEVTHTEEDPATGLPMDYLGDPVETGELRALTEGLGLRRSNPEIRRFMSLGQMVIDPADPAVFARHFHLDPLEFGTGEVNDDTRALIITTVGDMNVPASTGLTVGRAAGYINFLDPDPKWNDGAYAGSTQNQVVIDTFTAEAVHKFGRHQYGAEPNLFPEGVHMDIENFANGDDRWGAAIPRLDPPLRAVSNVDAYGNEMPGQSGAIFTYAVPDGQHGFALPGEMTEIKIEECRAECETACGADTDCVADCRPDCETQWRGETFDVGWYMFHVMGSFILDAQTSPFNDKCNMRTHCNDIPELPEPRDLADLP
jgi:hypothetical protein